jgi:hypothetical protein
LFFGYGYVGDGTTSYEIPSSGKDDRPSYR